MGGGPDKDIKDQGLLPASVFVLFQDPGLDLGLESPGEWPYFDHVQTLGLDGLEDKVLGVLSGQLVRHVRLSVRGGFDCRGEEEFAQNVNSCS